MWLGGLSALRSPYRARMCRWVGAASFSHRTIPRSWSGDIYGCCYSVLRLYQVHGTTPDGVPLSLRTGELGWNLGGNGDWRDIGAGVSVLLATTAPPSHVRICLRSRQLHTHCVRSCTHACQAATTEYLLRSRTYISICPAYDQADWRSGKRQGEPHRVVSSSHVCLSLACLYGGAYAYARSGTCVRIHTYTAVAERAGAQTGGEERQTEPSTPCTTGRRIVVARRRYILRTHGDWRRESVRGPRITPPRRRRGWWPRSGVCAYLVHLWIISPIHLPCLHRLLLSITPSTYPITSHPIPSHPIPPPAAVVPDPSPLSQASQTSSRPQSRAPLSLPARRLGSAFLRLARPGLAVLCWGAVRAVT